MFEDIQKRNFSVLGCGEVMLRLSPVGKERIAGSETFEKRAGGSELNVVSGISFLGMRTGMITKIPDNEIGKFIRFKIRYAGTSDDYVLTDSSPDKRLGVYYCESGAQPRPGIVSYDRKNSSFTTFRCDELPREIYDDASVFHTSGITLALDPDLCSSVIEMTRRFKETGTVISFDVNYRAALWSEEDARKTIERVLPLADILFVSEETCRRMFRMTGTHEEMQKQFAQKYPGLRMIASTKRKVISSSHHSFNSLVYDCKADRYYMEEPYDNIDVVDRIGSGDAYVAGALYGMMRFHDIEHAAIYGDALAALKDTVAGEFTECDLTDVERVIRNHLDSGLKNEMVR